MKFLTAALVLMTLTTSAFAKVTSITGAELIQNMQDQFFDYSISGSDDCVIERTKFPKGSSTMTFTIKKESTGKVLSTMTLDISQNFKVSDYDRSEDGDGSWYGANLYTLKTKAKLKPYIMVATYEDISDFDFAINPTGKDGDEVRCDWRE